MPFLPPNQQRQSTEGTVGLRHVGFNHSSCQWRMNGRRHVHRCVARLRCLATVICVASQRFLANNCNNIWEESSRRCVPQWTTVKSRTCFADWSTNEPAQSYTGESQHKMRHLRDTQSRIYAMLFASMNCLLIKTWFGMTTEAWWLKLDRHLTSADLYQLIYSSRPVSGKRNYTVTQKTSTFYFFWITLSKINRF